MHRHAWLSFQYTPFIPRFIHTLVCSFLYISLLLKHDSIFSILTTMLKIMLKIFWLWQENVAMQKIKDFSLFFYTWPNTYVCWCIVCGHVQNSQAGISINFAKSPVMNSARIFLFLSVKQALYVFPRGHDFAFWLIEGIKEKWFIVYVRLFARTLTPFPASIIPRCTTS
jgi:hypothetical protein